MGAYTLCSHGTGPSPNLVIASTGTEVQLAVSVAEALAAAGSTVRVVSMPCWELFDRQSIEYQREVTSFPSLPSQTDPLLIPSCRLSVGVPPWCACAVRGGCWCAWMDQVCPCLLRHEQLWALCTWWSGEWHVMCCCGHYRVIFSFPSDAVTVAGSPLAVTDIVHGVRCTSALDSLWRT
jgi:hypothetical protein